MTEEERRRFESLETLRHAAYVSFSDRRSYEWKLSLGIWTALAVLLAGLLQPAQPGEVFPVKSPWAWVVATVVAGALAFLHLCWSEGASRRNNVDVEVADHYASEMQRMLNVPYGEALCWEIACLPSRRGWKTWSHLAQISITVLLGIAAVVIVWARSHPTVCSMTIGL